MNAPLLHATDRPVAAAIARADMYNAIHKALRLMFADTLSRLGSADAANRAELPPVLAQCDELLDLLEMHYGHEDRFVHPALEHVQPGCTARIAGEHAQHRETIEQLREQVEVVRVSAGATRDAALTRLYRDLAQALADDFTHMRFEDSEFNAILWRHYSDAELHAIEGELVASIAPSKMARALRWMIPALNPAERAAFLGGARQGMPPEAFVGVLAIARERLDAAAWRKLAAALAVAA